MPRCFVIIGKSAAVMADRSHRLFKINKPHRAAFLSGDLDFSLSKDGIQRILREHVLDVRDEQFLMLLFMMNTENKDRLDFIQYLLFSIAKQVVDVGIDRCAVALRFSHRWARN